MHSCFNHGQFYVVVSRVAKKKNLYIILSKDEKTIPYLGLLALVKNI